MIDKVAPSVGATSEHPTHEAAPDGHFQLGVSHAIARGSRKAQVTGQRIFSAIVSVWKRLFAGDATTPPLSTIGSGVSFMCSSPAFAVSTSGSGLKAHTSARGATQVRSLPTALLARTPTFPACRTNRITIAAM